MRNATSGSSGGMREGRVLSRSRPSTPSAMNRSCHLQTQGFDFPVRRTISTVPAPSAVARMIPARPTCRCRLGRAPASPRRGALAFRLVRTSPSTPPAAGSAPRAALPSPKPPTQSPWRLHPARTRLRRFPKRSSSDFSLSLRRSAGAPHICRISMQRLLPRDRRDALQCVLSASWSHTHHGKGVCPATAACHTRQLHHSTSTGYACSWRHTSRIITGAGPSRFLYGAQIGGAQGCAHR